MFTRLIQVWNSVAEQGRSLLGLSQHNGFRIGIETLARDLLSERGEATNMARAAGIIKLYGGLTTEERDHFHLFLAQDFLPDPKRLQEAAKAYLDIPSPETVAELTLASEPPRKS